MRLLPAAFGVLLLLALLTWLLLRGLAAGSVDRLATTVGQQEELAERFKSSNALLQNSLSYVGLLSTSPTFGDQAAQLAPTIGALAAAILHLTRDSSPVAAKALQERIDRFAAQAPTIGRYAEAAQALLAHARLLHDLLPGVDETLKALVAVPSRQPLETIRALFADRQSVVEATAERFRLFLYLVSLLLVVMLVRLGLGLRASALALQRRAAFEHVIAKNSTHLINCPSAETEARVKQVLGELCRAIGVERAYVVLDAIVISHGASDPDGLHLARALHEIVPRRPMLFATTPTTDVSADGLAKARIAEVLSRPLVSSEVAAALARCLRPPGILRT